MEHESVVQWVYASKDNEELANRYNQWSKSYDNDLARDFDWKGHILCADTLTQYVMQNETIIDVGCGTGLCGTEMVNRGYSNIDGFDLSEGMLNEARSLNIYNDLRKGILGETLEYDSNSYDAAVAAGVFSQGHAPASGWDEVVRIIKPNGHFILTIRADSYELLGFKEKHQELIDSKKIELLESSPPMQLLPKGEPDVHHIIRVYKVLK